MKYRQTTILAEKTLNASGTEVIPINVKDPISRIICVYQARRYDYPETAHLAENISKIELVDGSDVLFSLNGSEIVGLNIFNNRIHSPMDSMHYPGNYALVPLSLDFGRKLFDPELALVPTYFSNPQLKITYNRVTFDAKCDVNKIAVYADLFDEKVISPVGFLMSKEHINIAMAQNTYKYVDLPTDHPVRLLILRSFLADYEPWYTTKEARLSEDNDKRVVFDWDINRYHEMRKGLDLPVIEGMTTLVSYGGSCRVYMTSTDFLGAVAGTGEVYFDWNTDSLNQRGGALDMNTEGNSGTFCGLIYGWLPCHCIQFPFGDQQDLDDWYEVQLKGSVQLRLLGGTAETVGVAQVVLQQLRRY